MALFYSHAIFSFSVSLLDLKSFGTITKGSQSKAFTIHFRELGIPSV